MQYFGTDIAAENCEDEIKEKYDKANKLWEDFQNLISRDGLSRCEVNEGKTWVNTVIKLIKET